MSKLSRATGTGAGMECVSESLAYWTQPIQEFAIDEYYFSEYTPVNSINSSSDLILFEIPQSSDFMDLCESLLMVNLKITQADGSNLPAFTYTAAVGNTAATGNSVGFIQSPISSIFSALDVRINGSSVSDSYNTYNYLAYFQLLLNFSKDAMNTRLSPLGYFVDKNPGVLRAEQAAPSSGFKTRANLTKESTLKTFIGPIFHSLFSQNRLLPPLTPLTLEFKKATNAFVLKGNTTDACIYHIDSIKLLMKKVKVLPTFKLEFEKKLMKSPLMLPLSNASVKPIHIPANVKEISFDNIFSGRSLPTWCCIGLVDQSHYRGNYQSSPYYFGHFNLTSLKISYDSTIQPSPNGFFMNYGDTNPDWTLAYMSLFNNWRLKVDAGSSISMEEYPNGFALYSIEFGNERGILNDHTSKKRNASARLDLTFATTSTNPALTLLIYFESDEVG